MDDDILDSILVGAIYLDKTTIRCHFLSTACFYKKPGNN